MILCPDSNQPKHDLVMTPPALAEAIVKHYQPSGVILDPCRGQGAFYNALCKLPNSTVNWCEITEGVDFFADHRPCDWIITNPPWSKMRRFLSHSMQLADNIVFLATITHFVTRVRLLDIRRAGFGLREALLVNHPPYPWPSSGFQLAGVHLQKGYKDGLIFVNSTVAQTELMVREHVD